MGTRTRPLNHLARAARTKREFLVSVQIPRTVQCLRQRGYTAVDTRAGGKVWAKSMEDGNTILIRVDPANTTRNMGYADEVPHAHKESVSSSCISNRDYGREDRPNVTKYNDSNEPIPSRGREREVHIQIEW